MIAALALALLPSVALAAWGARLPAALLPPPPCADGGRGGTVRALLVGVDEYREVDAAGRPYFAPLGGSANDAQLLAETVRRRGGAAPGNVRLLVGAEATADGFWAAVNDLLAATRCGDFVLLHFSGHTWRGALALSDASVRNGSGLVFEGELRRAVTALRNRGAFVLLHVDANVPEPLELDAGRGGRWRSAGGRVEGGLDLALDAGGFAGLFAGPLAFEQKVELPGTGGAREVRVYGLFSFLTAAALGEARAPTTRELAERIRARIPVRGRAGLAMTPAFEATEPDRPVFAVGAPSRTAAGPAPLPAPPPTQDARVEILQPRRARGVTLVTAADLLVEGRVVPAEAVAAVVVSGAQARLLPGGRFEARLALRPGPQTLYAVAVFRDHAIATDSVEVQGGAAPPPAAATGRRYALVVGNGDYRHMAKLRTPAADAEALAALLRSDFGFETALDLGDGRSLPLLLKDVGRRELFAALSQLRRRLGEEDSLLVFYAGHGDRPTRAAQAYWLPVDAEPDDHANWISADDIASEISLMNARHVLVVADSCFSGGLLRSGGPAAETVPGVERARYLDEMARRRSRHLMSSGANEPVLDEGGGGHSVFARALLAGLAAMPEGVFTAQQLFASRVQEPVAGRSGQSPQFGPILKSGHDGGDFVFHRRARER